MKVGTKEMDAAVRKANDALIGRVRLELGKMVPKVVQPNIPARGVVLALHPEVTKLLAGGCTPEEISAVMMKNGVSIRPDTLKRYARPSKGLKLRERDVVQAGEAPVAERPGPEPMEEGLAARPARAIPQGRKADDKAAKGATGAKGKGERAEAKGKAQKRPTGDAPERRAEG